MASTLDEDYVVLELTDPSRDQEELSHEEVSISTSAIDSWDLPSILRCRIVKIRANRSKLVQQSSYFRSLLGGSFSESSFLHCTIQWNMETFITILQFICGCSLNVTSSNFILLLEGALYFGVEGLLAECKTRIHKIFSDREPSALQMSLDDIIEFYNFGLEHGVAFVPELCKDFLALNFGWAISSRSVALVPYDLLFSCLEHPELTVDSEKQLCEALLIWLFNNTKSTECSHVNSKSNNFEILKKVRFCHLPLDYAAGLKRHFPQLADEIFCSILDLIEDCSSVLLHALTNNKLGDLKVRLTQHSEKIVLSGCAQITVAILFLTVLPSDLDITWTKSMMRVFSNPEHWKADHYLILKKPVETLSFQAVCEVDISRCPRVHFHAAVKWLCIAFPSLRILKASYIWNFKLEDFYYLMRKCPLITEVDLTADISPLIQLKVSVLSVSAERYQLSDDKEESWSSNTPKLMLTKPTSYGISKLTLEGRNDLNDQDLLKISALADSLSYLNIKGCTQVTDAGLSKLISKCPRIHSMVLSYTSFAKNSVVTLCTDNMLHCGSADANNDHKYSYSMAFRLEQLHIDGCKGVDQTSMLKLMKHAHMLRILSLRETSLNDDAFCNFMGSSLESLDVSETMVSVEALSCVIRRNPNVRCLKAIGCRNLHQLNCDDLRLTGGPSFKNLLCELGKSCILEEAGFGWGFSSLRMDKMEQVFCKLRSISVGLGASPGHHVLSALPKICPLLESVVLTFQVISDDVVRAILGSLKNLRIFGLHCCLGDLTSFSFRISMPLLRTLRLEWVTPWMTNNDLEILTQNCSTIVELSLSGCTLLDTDSQRIISSGWPGLTIIHLEDCGKLTSNGVSSLFGCKAVEDLLLRHNGQGIGRSFISDAASKWPLLRKVALDLCDACEGGFDSPNQTDTCFLSAVKISRCKSQRCGFGLQTMLTTKPVHKETIVLEWNSKELRTTVVKERL